MLCSTRLDDDDRVVDHDADREHHAEQRQRVDREAEQLAGREASPTSDTGTASIGISVARQLCRNRNTTISTSISASTKVCDHLSIDAVDELRSCRT